MYNPVTRHQRQVIALKPFSKLSIPLKYSKHYESNSPSTPPDTPHQKKTIPTEPLEPPAAGLSAPHHRRRHNHISRARANRTRPHSYTINANPADARLPPRPSKQPR